MNQQALLEFDQQHIWHPYTSMPAQYPPHAVSSAKGVYLNFMDGRHVIDGMSSWWSAIHGYNHPRLNQAAHQQIDSMSHVMFGGLTHQPAVDLIERLLKLTPHNLQKVFLCDSGSVSVEVALKMAIQYWQAKKQTDKSRFLALKGAYHGDTLAAMSVCDPVNGMHHLFNQILPQHFFADRPRTQFHEKWQEDDLLSITQLIEQHHQSLAAVIVEPIVQGAGGMWFYHPNYLKAVRQLCNEYDILLIADEIATGFGRTGKLFACEQADITPDILCLGKAITGGYLSLAATLTSEHIATSISSSEAGCFMHGPTFMANPLACAIASASIDELLESNWQENIDRIQTHFRQSLLPIIDLPNVADVRVLGAIAVIEMVEDIDVPVIQDKLLSAGVWCRPFGKLLYSMPAYIISDDELQVLTHALQSVLKQQ